jgi:hypothetical protein
LIPHEYAGLTQPNIRFCPRCGAGSVAGMPFCPQCGLDIAGLEAAAPGAVSVAQSPAPAEAEPVAPAPPQPEPAPSRRLTERGRGLPPIIVAGLLVMVGLLGYGLLTRSSGPAAGASQAGGSAGGGAGGSAAPALISGLTILSPTDGQAVATKDVNVIGTAPPGVTITQDISFGLDQHTTSDGTGHWAIRVGLKEGENKLVFRIGDDASTRKEIRVTYTPPAQG